MENEEQDLSDEVLIIMRDILDMLTRENLGILVHAAKLLPIDTPNLLSTVADLIYEKALEDERFCSNVATYCQALSKLTVRREGSDDGKEALTVSRLIINKCQLEFERNHMEDTSASSETEDDSNPEDDDSHPEDDDSHPEDRCESEKAKLKQRSVANIRFIGELYNLGMLAPTIMERILETFLMKRDEESLESLHAFLTTIGKRFEMYCIKQGRLKMFGRHFQTVQDIANEQTATKRVRYIMLDLVELWRNKWLHRKEIQDNEPSGAEVSETNGNNPSEKDRCLKTAVYPWVSSSLQTSGFNAKLSSTEEMVKRMRGILNKLSNANLEKMVYIVKLIPIYALEHLSVLADLVYEKAVNEHLFSSTFASLCQSLTDLSVQMDLENGKHEIKFTRMIIKKCQTEFETETKKEMKTLRMAEIQACTDPRRKLELKLQWESEDTKLRQRAIGNMKFIGELYKLHMLKPSIIMRIIATLLSKCDDESLECLCTLLITVGKVLEMQCLRQNQLMEDFNESFRKLKEIANDSSVSNRVRFIIVDVLDLRLNQWFPRRKFPVDDLIMYSRGREHVSESTRSRISNIIPGWDPADVFLVEDPHKYEGDGPIFIKPKPLGGYSSDAGWVYHEDLSRLHPIDRRYIPQNGTMHVEFDLNKGQEKFVDYTEHGETFRNILQWILNHRDQLTATPERLSVDFITYIGYLIGILKTPYNPELEWVMYATEFKGSVYMGNILINKEMSETAEDSSSEEESVEEDESEEEDLLSFKLGLWGHVFEHYMTGGDPDEGVDCVKSYRCFLKTSVGGHTLLYAPKMDGVDPDLFEDNFDSMDAFISLKCCKELSDERMRRNHKRFKLRTWWDEHQLTGNPRIIVGYRNEDGIVHTLEMLKSSELPQIAEGKWHPNAGFNFLVEVLDFVKRKVHTDPGKAFIFVRKSYGHMYCKKLKKQYYILPTWYTNQLFATDSLE